MRSTPCDRRQQNRDIFFRKNYCGWQDPVGGRFKEAEIFCEMVESLALDLRFEVGCRFGQRITGTAQADSPVPKLQESSPRPISGGKQHVRVEKQAVHLSRPPVRYLVGIKTYFADFFAGLLIIGCVHGIGQ